jgi:hypothetical protein
MGLRPAQLRINLQGQAALGSEWQVGEGKAIITQEECCLVQSVLAPRILCGVLFKMGIW